MALGRPCPAPDIGAAARVKLAVSGASGRPHPLAPELAGTGGGVQLPSSRTVLLLSYCDKSGTGALAGEIPSSGCGGYSL